MVVTGQIVQLARSQQVIGENGTGELGVLEACGAGDQRAKGCLEMLYDGVEQRVDLGGVEPLDRCRRAASQTTRG